MNLKNYLTGFIANIKDNEYGKLRYTKIKKYKYRNNSLKIVRIHIRGLVINHKYFSLDKQGYLRILEGYLWDGCSGPTWDTRNTMLAGLIHDVLYQMIRIGLLNLIYKNEADKILRSIMLKKGAWKFRANYYYQAVDKLGSSSCVPNSEVPDEVFLA